MPIELKMELYIISSSPHSDGQPLMLATCDIEKTDSGLPDKDNIPVGSLERGRGTNVAACEHNNIHLRLSPSNFKIIVNDREQDKIIGHLYDDLADLALKENSYFDLTNFIQNLDLNAYYVCTGKFGYILDTL